MVGQACVVAEGMETEVDKGARVVPAEQEATGWSREPPLERAPGPERAPERNLWAPRPERAPERTLERALWAPRPYAGSGADSVGSRTVCGLWSGLCGEKQTHSDIWLPTKAHQQDHDSLQSSCTPFTVTSFL